MKLQPTFYILLDPLPNTIDTIPEFRLSRAQLLEGAREML